MNRPSVELSDIINRYEAPFIEQFRPLDHHKRVLRDIASCRTAERGGHVDRCDQCGHMRISYNSCRNRHCPRCQQVNRERWIMAREADLISVGYFHVVFTLPGSLNELCHQYPKSLYDLLFTTVRDTLFAMAANAKFLGAEIGYIAVLHTWGQTLTLHPHLHCIIPAGGITVKGNWKHSLGDGTYLFPVKIISQVFKAKFRDGLRQIAPRSGFEVPNELISRINRSNWVVYAKEPFAGPKQVVEYLGRYSHRVAITNHRLISVNNDRVTFRYKDYRQQGAQKQMTLDALEFLRRFCLHILPPRFVKIRHYGFLSSRRKGEELPKLQTTGPQAAQQQPKPKLSWQEVCRQRLGFDPEFCPCCKKGKMQTIELLHPRSPPSMLTDWNQAC